MSIEKVDDPVIEKEDDPVITELEPDPVGLSFNGEKVSPKLGFEGLKIRKSIVLVIVVILVFIFGLIVVTVINKNSKKEAVTQATQDTNVSDNTNPVGDFKSILAEGEQYRNKEENISSAVQSEQPNKKIKDTKQLAKTKGVPVPSLNKQQDVPSQKELEAQRQATQLQQFKSQQLRSALVGDTSVKIDFGTKKTTNQTQQNTGRKNQQPVQNQAQSQQDDQNRQAQKLAFTEAKHSNTYLSKSREEPLSQFELKVGTVIPATLISGINSDLPGQVIASVSQNVYDSATGNHLLLPQGAKLYGVYDSSISYGQDRLLMAWTRVNYPDGTTLELEGMSGVDSGGFAGFSDQVNHHYWKIFGNAFILGMITGVSQAGISDDDDDDVSTSENINNGVTQQFAETGSKLIEKNLDAQATITIRNGYKFNVMLNKDIILKPYSPL